MIARSLKILYVHNQINIGGGERSLLALFKELKKKLYELYIACPPIGDFPDQMNHMGLQILPIWFKGIRHPLTMMANCHMLIRMNQYYRFDIIHSNSPQTNIPSGIAGRISGVPVVWHARVLLEKGMIDLDRFFFWLPSMVICNSQAIRNRFHHIREYQSKSAAIINGVDTVRFCPEFVKIDKAKLKLGIETETFVVGCFDRLDPVKDHETILYAVKELYKRFPKIILLIVGEAFDASQERRKFLGSMATELGISDAIRFLGFHDDVRPIMAACDIVVQASRSEGCSRVICEAQAMGKPVIATDIGGNPEILKDGITGYLFPAAKSPNLAKLMERFIVNDSLKGKIGESARKKAVTELSIERYCNEIESVYIKLIEEKRANRSWCKKKSG
ncbi:MAG: glycosyltransferase family 4 protein [Desulfobacterales bacterium]|uniref:Glycosyltransferase family 4 protein n=1 Tax=Candidatus Desulfatibia vada TaxID=2841696 RepID=A0A8J6NZM5_9BACT|nr:glycosyltransferase family 4 protein [Candidatus Desulfatibia vada]